MLQRLLSSFDMDKFMRLKSLYLSLISLLMVVIAACGGSDDYSVITVSPSTCVVTSVELGKILRVIHTKTDEGKDSLYVVTVTGRFYPMSIDHYSERIFNVDSLPYGCDAAKVTFTTLGASGTLAINSLSQQDVDTFFVATDSTDFSKPRKVTVYAPNGVAKRTYEMEIRVHQEEGDKFVWHKQAEALDALAGMDLTAAYVNEGSLFVYGMENGQPVVLTALCSAPTEWTKSASAVRVNAPTLYNGAFYAISDGALVQSNDGVVWANVATNLATPMTALVAGSTALYAVTEGGFFTSTDGVNWAQQEADEPEYLPTEICSAACLPSLTDKSFEDIIVVGSRNGIPVVWKLNVDTKGDYTHKWNYYPETPLNPYPCPALATRQVYAYDGGTLLMGEKQDGTSVVYLSRDNGRTWKNNEIPQLEGVSAPIVTAVDANHFIWVISQDGKVMKGRYNRLGWVNQDRVFTE